MFTGERDVAMQMEPKNMGLKFILGFDSSTGLGPEPNLDSDW